MFVSVLCHVLQSGVGAYPQKKSMMICAVKIRRNIVNG